MIILTISDRVRALLGVDIIPHYGEVRIQDVVEMLLVYHSVYVWVTFREKEDGSGKMWWIGNAKKLPPRKEGEFEVNEALYQPRNTIEEAWDALLVDVLTKINNGEI